MGAFQGETETQKTVFPATPLRVVPAVPEHLVRRQ
jgi:hypothetical protein